jgi:hypothetical protein
LIALAAISLSVTAQASGFAIRPSSGWRRRARVVPAAPAEIPKGHDRLAAERLGLVCILARSASDLEGKGRMSEPSSSELGERRKAAIKRLKAKRGFKAHLAIFVAVNTLLLVIWASSGSTYFWPIWVLLGWGIGLGFHGWSVYYRLPISEDEIRREMERGN